MLVFGPRNLSVGTEGVEDRHMIPARVSKFPPCVSDGIAVFTDVDEKLGRCGEDGDDIKNLRGAVVIRGSYDGASVLWFKGE
jgi:hypothetical protein